MAKTAQKILIVDNDPNLALALELLFAQNGFQVVVCPTGEDALDRLEVFTPNILIMEVQLPYKSGFEICQIVRARPQWFALKIILLTVKDRQAEMVKGLALGADAYMTKPFSTRELLNKIRDLLETTA